MGISTCNAMFTFGYNRQNLYLAKLWVFSGKIYNIACLSRWLTIFKLNNIVQGEGLVVTKYV